MAEDKNILVLGLGNDCLGDDAVGLRVVQELRRRLRGPRPAGDERPSGNGGEGGNGGTDPVKESAVGGTDGVDLVEAATGGMILLDLIVGYRGLILIDAIKTSGSRPGRIHRLTEDRLPAGDSTAPWSAHHMGLRQILETGRRVGCDLPRTVVVYGVETEVPGEWQRGCSPQVERAVPEVVSLVIGEISVMEPAARQGKGSQ